MRKRNQEDVVSMENGEKSIKIYVKNWAFNKVEPTAERSSSPNHYRQLNTEIYEIYTGLSETVYYTQRLFP